MTFTDANMDRIALCFGTKQSKIYFDNISIQEDVEEPEVESDDIITEDGKALIRAEMDTWIKDMMTSCNGYVKAWDVINEPMAEDGTLRATPSDYDFATNATEFYIEDYLGENYAREVIATTREYGPSDMTLFVNDYNLEKYYSEGNKKCVGLISQIEKWEEDGITTIDGIGTQMHLFYSLDQTTQQSNEDGVTQMFTLLATTGKLIRISEIDMSVTAGGANDDAIVYGDSRLTDDVHEKMALYYKFVIEQYFKIIPAAQQYGITHWSIIDSASDSSWKAGEPVGLWYEDLTRKWAYVGFVEGLQSQNSSAE